MADRPTLLDVIEAKRRIEPYVARTPLHHYPSLDQLIGAEVHVKHENHQLLGAFKMRGALNVVAQLSDEEKQSGVIVATSGNFGQGIAYAGGVFGVEANVVVPVDANPGKVESIRRLGANLIFHGNNFDDSREHAERLAQKRATAMSIRPTSRDSFPALERPRWRSSKTSPTSRSLSCPSGEEAVSVGRVSWLTRLIRTWK